MKSQKHRPWALLISGALALCLALVVPATNLQAQAFPQYDHVFLVMMESENFKAIIGNQDAPILNALAKDYGLATNYSGVGDPSEPNYVAILGGDTFGLNNDDPYWFPGHTINASNLMTQLEAAGKTWRGYFQNMPYAGYRGYCYPDKCNGIPDADTQYVAKHNGIVNFANMQNPAEFGKMFPFKQLAADLTAGTISNFSYIVPDECHDMHGAPPWCVDSGPTSSVQQSFLIAQGDAFVGSVVNDITASSIWQAGNNAIVITFDEGNTASSNVATIVVTSHGPRGVTDKTSLNHFSLLGSLEATFGLPCLANACSANLMTKLFTITGSTTVPTLPPPFISPTSSDTISAQGAGKAGSAVSLAGLTTWTQVSSPNFGSQDNVFAGVSAASAWSVVNAVDAGVNGNQFYAVKALATNNVYAVGQQAGAAFPNQALIEHWDGTSWSAVTDPADAATSLPLGVTATASALTVVGEQETDAAVYTSYVAAGAPTGLGIQTIPALGAGENDPFAVTIANDGTTWVVGWVVNPATDLHDPLVLQGVNGTFSVVSVPNPSNGGDTGFSAITTIPGGGMWAVGGTATAKSNVQSFIEFHP